MQSKKKKEVINEIDNIVRIFTHSEGKIRPHHILVGPSGSGKSYTIQSIANKYKLGYVDINAAQLTKEGTSGNSLSKALIPLQQHGNDLMIVFVDEFDKLFISGNSNSSLAHETTNGVQNEFLKVLESDEATISGDYGKYIQIPVSNTLFIFAGAFNGEENITIDRLRDFGIKTEFIGRVGLVFNLERLSVDDLIMILDNSPLLHHYLKLFPKVTKEECVKTIKEFLIDSYNKNTLGARLITTLIHQYFIKNGKLGLEETKKIVFQSTLDFQVDDANKEGAQ